MQIRPMRNHFSYPLSKPVFGNNVLPARRTPLGKTGFGLAGPPFSASVAGMTGIRLPGYAVDPAAALTASQ
ncbi:hypothetical protein Tamer19_00550 [Cupriavidus sp. TA19]|nr:hypothetical protein Tamer19_00550 [Cupriavidus sp. TA19]